MYLHFVSETSNSLKRVWYVRSLLLFAGELYFGRQRYTVPHSLRDAHTESYIKFLNNDSPLKILEDMQ